jgi:hypothetical protein
VDLQHQQDKQPRRPDLECGETSLQRMVPDYKQRLKLNQPDKQPRRPDLECGETSLQHLVPEYKQRLNLKRAIWQVPQTVSMRHFRSDIKDTSEDAHHQQPDQHDRVGPFCGEPAL